jgi:O-antigen ligase
VNIVLCLAFLVLLFKDTSPLGDHYFARGVSQTLCLAAGLYWFLTKESNTAWRKYLLLMLFLLAIALGVSGSENPFYTGLQVLSLGAVFIFFVAYNESVAESEHRFRAANIVLWAGMVVLPISLMAIKVWPQIAYEYDPIERISRFRGLFGKPAAMAALAAIILGLAHFMKLRLLVKIPALIISGVCLALTYSRTFWAAWLVAMSFTWWWCTSKRRLLSIVLIGAMLIAGYAFAVLFDLRLSMKSAEATLRSDSIMNMSGRTLIWKYAFKYFLDRPFLGYGFTTGDDAFRVLQPNVPADRYILRGNIMSEKRFTLHNGYIQAILDSGLFGGCLYLGLLGRAIVNVMRVKNPLSAPALYVLMFVLVANIGESVMFSAATMTSLFAWYAVVFGLSLADEQPVGEIAVNVTITRNSDKTLQ